jgi:sugar O-acyltransferase (sialic acid O-acetyltransferase NeuD family)
MTIEKIAIYGSGAFGQEVYLLIQLINKYSKTTRFDFIGFFDDEKNIGIECRYGRVIGNYSDINKQREPFNLAIAIGSCNGLYNMKKNIKNDNIKYPNLLSPDNIFFDMDSIKIGVGNIILSNSIVSYDVIIGNFNIINTRVNFGHHVEIGNFNILNPNVQLSGNSKIGNNNSLGLNSALLPKKSIGDFNVVVPGSIITKNFKNNNFIAGNPALNIKL